MVINIPVWIEVNIASSFFNSQNASICVNYINELSIAPLQST